MTRRMFVAGIATVCVPPERLVLQAIAAERMPYSLTVSGVEKSPFFELRDYGWNARPMTAIWNRHGMRAVEQQRGKFLFPFESLAARERAWREMSADPQWVALSAAVELKELAVFRLKGQLV